MPTVWCPICKKNFSAGRIPESSLHFLLPDNQLDSVIERLQGPLGDDPEATMLYVLQTSGAHVYACPDCGSLIVEGEDELAGTYKKVFVD